MSNRCLIVVDAQYDFFVVSKEDYLNGRGGALGVPDSSEIIPVINELLPKYDLIIFTKDWHVEDMEAFASSHEGKQPFDTYINSKGEKDTLWPGHCVQNTRGADIHEGIDFDLIKKDFYIFKKGLKKDSHPYSGFGAEGLTEFLKEKGVDEVHIVGLATDYCCKDTAIDAVQNGFKTVFIIDGMRGINPDNSETIEELLNYGIDIIES